MSNNFLIDTEKKLMIIDLSKGLIQKILTAALLMAIGSASTRSVIAGYPLIAEAKRPKAPQTGTPSGHTTPGTTRPEANCPATPKPLTGLFANQGQDFTLSEFPTFLFYVPYGAKDISLMEFLLLDETQTKMIYHTSVQLNQQPGIIRIQLPQEARYALAENQTYHWRFNLDCKSNQATVPDLFLQGWIRRIPINSEIKNQLQSAQSPEYLVYRDHRIWYDAIANLAELHFATPENEQLTQAWNDILKSIKLDWIITEPLVDSKNGNAKDVMKHYSNVQSSKTN